MLYSSDTVSRIKLKFPLCIDEDIHDPSRPKHPRYFDTFRFGCVPSDLTSICKLHIYPVLEAVQTETMGLELSTHFFHLSKDVLSFHAIIVSISQAGPVP